MSANIQPPVDQLPALADMHQMLEAEVEEGLNDHPEHNLICDTAGGAISASVERRVKGHARN